MIYDEMCEPLLKAERLAKRFGAVEAVSEATFEVHRGAITAFLGENGAGKTTVIKIVTGFLGADSGSFSWSVRRIGYVPERPAFLPWLKGEQILQATARAFDLSDGEAAMKADEFCRRVSFDPSLLSRKVQTYSPGNQKKFAYLQNLIIRPDFLIVDEPFSALDPIGIKGVRELFLELEAEGKTLLLSSHLISELEKVSDEYIIIKSGRVTAQGTLCGNPSLETVFFHYAGKEPLGSFLSHPRRGGVEEKPV
jgi:ABC-type multidrug transport system ATPase subunit